MFVICYDTSFFPLTRIHTPTHARDQSYITVYLTQNSHPFSRESKLRPLRLNNKLSRIPPSPFCALTSLSFTHRQTDRQKDRRPGARASYLVISPERPWTRCGVCCWLSVTSVTWREWFSAARPHLASVATPKVCLLQYTSTRPATQPATQSATASAVRDQ